MSTKRIQPGEDIAVRMGRRLRRLREKRGWSQTYLSVHLGMDRSYLSDLERGKREACVRSLEVIALGFEMSISQFMRGV